ncbi:MAG: tetratricopeptide repeat protein [Pseudomonadota bacterium]
MRAIDSLRPSMRYGLNKDRSVQRVALVHSTAVLQPNSLMLVIVVIFWSVLMPPTAHATSPLDTLITHLEADVKQLRGNERTMARGRLALTLDANGRVEEALKEYQRLIRTREGSQWRYLLGVTLIQSGQSAEAVRVLRRLVQQSSGGWIESFWLAVAQQSERDEALWPEGVSEKTKAQIADVNWGSLTNAQRLTVHWGFEAYPPDPILERRIGYVRDESMVAEYIGLVRDTRPKSALRILSSLPGDPTLSQLVDMASLSLELDLNARALDTALAGLAISDDEIFLHRIAARLYSERGRDDLAYLHLTRIVDSLQGAVTSDADRSVVEQLGLIEVRNGRQQVALELLRRADTWTGAYQAGLIEGARRNYRAAISSFERAIALNPTCERCFFFLGQSLGELGQFEEARDAIRQSQALRDSSEQGQDQ